ncbi:transketolase [Wolbachia pipientis]|uniref:Transketolase n=1 Tax=Wolbachia pipientis TaxID=955 RepID=A0A1E7QKR8_WOLPI|nr:transketolase [Wolbachia pipientis]OEY87071.1 transketolase [Wolbachia pipientis]
MNDLYHSMANAVRFLSVDATYKANSGHPGMPLGMADVATVLFAKFMNYNHDDQKWFNRDRFVLSNGHGSMLLYAILYLIGYINIDELKNFRQLGSKTPGHPEYGITSGVEATTGPLGQGFACAVGMALAEAILRARFKVNHYTYVMVGDGCLMEGISHEAASLAGNLKLNKLIVFFDDNDITIDGKTSLACSDNIEKRFLAYGWNTSKIDGHDFNAISLAIEQAHKSDRPSLICCKTIIGKFSSRAGTSSAHSGALTEEDMRNMRKELNWSDEPFYVPEHIKSAWDKTTERAKQNYDKVEDNVLQRRIDKHLPDDFNVIINNLKKQIYDSMPNEATRSSFGRVMESLTKFMPELIGGSADLTGSNCTKYQHMQAINSSQYNGSYIYYGVREHGMAACMNGMALHGGIIPYGGTFLVFSDYCRPSIRLAALMKQQVIYVMTHDSIGVGEDGPTHQPIEHLASLRAIPNLYVFRPADAIETLECISIALEKNDSPSLFALSRQNVNYVRKFNTQSNNLSKLGAYILRECSGKLDVTIFATGSELCIAIEAYEKLQKMGIGIRIVSMPCWRIFDEQDNKYKSTLLVNDSIKVAIEAGSDVGWHKYIGSDGIFIGMKDFGESAPYKVLYEHFKINVDHVVKYVLGKIR